MCRWFEKDSLDPEVLDKLLPASQNGLELVVKVCDAYEVIIGGITNNLNLSLV